VAYGQNERKKRRSLGDYDCLDRHGTVKIIEIVGGLGNQMFQYAFFLAVRKLCGTDGSMIFTGQFNETRDNQGYQLLETFGIRAPEADVKIVNAILKGRDSIIQRGMQKLFPGWKGYYCEQKFYYEARVLDLANRPEMYFRGHWQDQLYFQAELSNEVLKAFTFVFPENDHTTAYRLKIQRCEAVSIHVRRGDYYSNPKYASILGGICTEDYYKRAIQEIEKTVEKPTYFIFSNDRNWVTENCRFLEGRDFVVVAGNSGRESVLDMKLMAQCRHNIIANSSFSWWGAWLNRNPNKIVIGPTRWFKNDLHLEKNHVIPDEWKKV